MIVSDDTLRSMIAEKSIQVEPLEPYQIQPAPLTFALAAIS